MKPRILGLLAVGLLIGPMVASAFSFTFDNSNLTVVRPMFGSVNATFIGTLSLDSGESVFNQTVSGPCIPSVACLIPFGTSTTFDTGNAARFFFIIGSSTALGQYTGYSVFRYSGIDGPSLPSPNYSFSLNVVDRIAVPEPGTLALLGVGLLGLGLSRRRKAA